MASSTASAAPALNTACDARALGINAPTTTSVAYANPASSPCAFDSVSLADATVTVIPGIPGITGVAAAVHAIKSTTSYASAFGFASTEGQTDVARVQVTAPGLLLSATGVHSQSGVNINPDCGGAASGESWIASLTVNGKVIQVGNKPITLNLGLRIVISINQTIKPNSHEVTQNALSITGPDKRYSIVVGQSHARLQCVT